VCQIKGQSFGSTTLQAGDDLYDARTVSDENIQ
jgi:hypothetical protein